MQNRRQFLGAMAAPALTACFDPARRAELDASLQARSRDPRTPEEVATDESFWVDIARSYTVDRSLIHLNNGGVSPSPLYVQEAMKRQLDVSNSATSFTMWRIQQPNREGIRQQLAQFFGCSPEEIAITRNASESLQICQFGFDLNPGDTVVTTELDYPRMLNTFEQRVRRDRIELVKIPLPTPIGDPAEVVEAFEKAMDEHRPKMVLLCHMLTSTGAVLPVRDVARAGRERGIPVIVDGAHSFGHLDFRCEDLECDYYATSLHKWLSAPHGTGMLYVKQDRIADLWPLMAAMPKQTDDIRKFEEIGTHPLANVLAIGEALTFHQTIGSARKQARLRYLREYWLERIVDRYPDRVTCNTNRAPGMAGAIASVRIEDVDSTKLSGYLLRKHRIVTTAIGGPGFHGLRVSPHVYTTLPELDRFVAAVEHVVHHGLPA